MSVDMDFVDDVEQNYRKRSSKSFQLFVRGLIIPGANGPKLFNLCIAPFQEKCFKLLGPTLTAIRDGTMPPRRRFWIERTKKAGKDSDIAICLAWLMAFPKRPILIQVSAANQQQAGIIKRRTADLLYYNQWLAERIHIQQNKIIGFEGLGEVVIEATGSSGAKQGDTPDLLILNELVHVDRWGVNETHMNNADGVPRGVVIISTNAGIRGTRAEQWKNNATNNPERWTVDAFKGVAPWIDKKDIEDAKRRDPVGAEYRRLWLGEWISGVGGALDDATINSCFVVPGPLTEPEDGWRYVAGLDLGISHDHSGIVVLGSNRSQQLIRVAWLRGFVPTLPNDRGQKEVDAADVQETCRRISKQFNISWFGYDPAAGGSFMAQQLRAMSVSMKEVSFSSTKNRNEMAVSLIQVFRGRRIQCYEDEEGRLRRDFGKFQIIPKVPSGYELKAVSDEWGHADVGTALLICLPKAIQIAGISPLFNSEDVLFGDDCEDEGDVKNRERNELDDIIDGDYEDRSMRRKFATTPDW